MRRADKALTDVTALVEILRRVTVGYLGLVDEEEPYVVPVNFVYIDGVIYFHGAAEGRKMRLLIADPSPPVAFVAAETEGFLVGKEACASGTSYRSVMVRGRARLVTDEAEKLRALQGILEKCLPQEDVPLSPAMVVGYRSRAGSPTMVVAIAIEEMSGKKSG